LIPASKKRSWVKSVKKKLSRVVTMGVHIGLGDTSEEGPAAVRWLEGRLD
jgi:hypothetical protein